MIKSLYGKIKGIYDKIGHEKGTAEYHDEDIERVIEQEVSKRVEKRIQELKARQHLEQLEKEKQERSARAKQEQQEKQRITQLERARKERLEKQRLEQKEKAREEQQEKQRIAQLERARQERLEEQWRVQREKARQEQQEKQRHEQLEREQQERQEIHRRKLREQARQAQMEKQKKERIEREQNKQLEKEKLEQIEKARKEQLEIEKKERIEREQQEQLEKVKKLVAFYNLNLVNGVTPLMKAAANNDAMKVKQLIDSGENPNACNIYLETALIYTLKSIKRGSFSEVVEILLQNGANPHVQTTLGPTAYTYATTRKDTKSIELLEAYQVNNNVYTPTITNTKRKKRREEVKKVSQPNKENMQQTIETNRQSTDLKQTKKKYADRSHAYERSFYAQIREEIALDIASSRERFRKDDLGGGNQFTNAVLRGGVQDQIRKLEDQYRKPYFGRVIYKTSNNKTKSMWIGDYSYGSTVISWTVPAASLFYQKKLGPVTHPTLGKVKVELIRQIHHGEIHDLEVTKSGYYDPILHKKLGEQANHKLGDIVETIQAEQDEILRKPKNQFIIVQGSAGSGKTTIALHRIPYLLQAHKEIESNQILFLGPNKLFLNYIDEVLPGIGVENTEQDTFEGWVTARINPTISGYSLTDYNQNINMIEKLTGSREEIVIEKCKLKGSLAFKKGLETYIQEYMTNFCAVSDFTVTHKDNKMDFHSERIRRWFNYDYQSTPFYERKQKIMNRLHAEFESFMIKVKNEQNLSNSEVEAFTDKFKQELAKFKASHMHYMNMYELYYSFIMNREWLQAYVSDCFSSEESMDFFVNYAFGMYQDKEIEYDDLAALLLLYSMLHDSYGVPERKTKKDWVEFSRKSYQYLVIDEAQDYNPFQIAMLKSVTAKGSIMLVGDLGQSIHEYRGISSWDEFKDLLNDGNDQGLLYQELSTSYRSTNEITELANGIIRPYSLGDNGHALFNLSKPVGRNGKKPSIITSRSNEMIEDVATIVREIISRNVFNIGIITKTRNEATQLYSKLFPHVDDIMLFDNANNTYEGGAVILPSYLSKGLEFDAVIAYNVTRDKYQYNSNDMKLLYVATTRALNELYVVAEENDVSVLLDEDLMKE